MIAQYSAAALVNESRSLGSPATDSTSVSGGQEDHVSMSTESAHHARTAVENALAAVGVELLCGAQAMEFVHDGLEPGTGTGAAYDAIREHVPPLDADRPLHTEIEVATELVATGRLDDAVGRALDEPIE
jgi:histidine ammonia-lyase